MDHRHSMNHSETGPESTLYAYIYTTAISCIHLYTYSHENIPFPLQVYVDTATCTNTWQSQIFCMLRKTLFSSTAVAGHLSHLLCTGFSSHCFSIYVLPQGSLMTEKGLTPAQFCLCSKAEQAAQTLTEFHCSPSRNWYILKKLVSFYMTWELCCNLFICASRFLAGKLKISESAFRTWANSFPIG